MNVEPRPTFAFDLDETQVLFHDAVDLGQSEAVPFPASLVVKKVLEILFRFAQRDSDAIIADHKTDPVSRGHVIEIQVFGLHPGRQPG